MKIITQASLKDLNTFGIQATASYFAEIHSVSDLVALKTMDVFQHEKLIIGSGSNILFTKNFDGLVLFNSIKGIEIVKKTEDYYYIKSNGGELWHSFVLFCIENNVGGVENLSLIPGTVGAAPIQNIGAYGVELQQVFESLEAFNFTTGTVEIFSKEACAFGYRDSIFKHTAKGNYFIISITCKLQKKPVLNMNYGAIKDVLEKNDVKEISVKAISDAVIQIRKSKLPDPKILGNAGSFFKNPEVDTATFNNLKEKYPDLPGYKIGNNYIKIPAGYLIEQCGWKGKKVGNTGAHKDQALVLVNYGNATGKEIYNLALAIKESVFKKFAIHISTEVNIL